MEDGDGEFEMCGRICRVFHQMSVAESGTKDNVRGICEGLLSLIFSLASISLIQLRGLTPVEKTPHARY